MVGKAQDITERKIIESQLEDQQKLVIQTSKMTALGEMASGIAHEINNPLGIINSLVSDIRDLYEFGQFEEKKALGIIEKIEFTIDRAAKVINGLRAFARDTGNEKVQRAKVKQILDAPLSFCSEKMKNHGVDLRLPVISEDLMIECQPIQISQVLINLLNNSYDAIQASAEKWIQIEANDLGSKVELSISDSGPGIPNEVKEKIFQPFFTTKAIGKGTGLGLSISKGILSKHGGSLRLDDQFSNTRFMLVLPKEQSKDQLTK